MFAIADWKKKKGDGKLGVWEFFFFMHESVFWKVFLETEKFMCVCSVIWTEVRWHDDMYKICGLLDEIS